jgi:hypothetical protein
MRGEMTATYLVAVKAILKAQEKAIPKERQMELGWVPR